MLESISEQSESECNNFDDYSFTLIEHPTSVPTFRHNDYRMVGNDTNFNFNEAYVSTGNLINNQSLNINFNQY